MAAVAVIVAGVLFARDAPRAWRAIVFVPALLAGLGAFQVRARTCVALAARGQRNMDAGVVAIQDPDERSVEHWRIEAHEGSGPLSDA